MPRKNSPDEVKAWKNRWTLVNEFEKEELRKTPLEVKFRQLAELMASVTDFGWESSLAAEEVKVRQRWQELYRAWKKKQRISSS